VGSPKGKRVAAWPLQMGEPRGGLERCLLVHASSRLRVIQSYESVGWPRTEHSSLTPSAIKIMEDKQAEFYCEFGRQLLFHSRSIPFHFESETSD
jgi:hypothetical protein